MKKYLFTLITFFLLSTNAFPWGDSPFGPVPPDDSAYDESAWDGSYLAPTQNAVRDEIESIVSSPEFTGDITIIKTDPTVIYDAGQAGDTDFWTGVQDDNDGVDDDKFQVGKGTTPGTDPFVTVLNSGYVGINTVTPADELDVAGKIAINGTSRVYFPDQTDFLGTMYLGNGDGGASLSHTTGDEGRYNTFIGIGSGNNNTTGYCNIANGYNSLYNNTTGNRNTANGHGSLYLNTIGNRNTANGMYSLYSNTTGTHNTANGYQSLYSNTTGISNIVSGNWSLYSNTTGNYNTASGNQALYDLGSTQTAGAFNVGTSYTIKTVGTTDFTLIGAANNDVGTVFTASGVGAGTGTATPNGTDNNTAVGYDTGRGIIYGTANTILGANVTGLGAGLSNNVIIADGDGNRRINVDENGNVGIGTIAPEATLSVNGSQSVHRTPTAIDYNPSALTSDYIIAVTNTDAARAITISTEDGNTGSTDNPRIFIVKDESGGAASHNITITLEEGGNIDGAASKVISTNYGSVSIYVDGTNGFIF